MSCYPLPVYRRVLGEPFLTMNCREGCCNGITTRRKIETRDNRYTLRRIEPKELTIKIYSIDCCCKYEPCRLLAAGGVQTANLNISRRSPGDQQSFSEEETER